MNEISSPQLPKNNLKTTNTYRGVQKSTCENASIVHFLLLQFIIFMQHNINSSIIMLVIFFTYLSTLLYENI